MDSPGFNKEEFQKELNEEMENLKVELEQVNKELELNTEEIKQGMKRVKEEMKKIKIDIKIDLKNLKEKEQVGNELTLGAFTDKDSLFLFGGFGFRSVGTEAFAISELYVTPHESGAPSDSRSAEHRPAKPVGNKKPAQDEEYELAKQRLLARLENPPDLGDEWEDHLDA